MIFRPSFLFFFIASFLIAQVSASAVTRIAFGPVDNGIVDHRAREVLSILTGSLQSELTDAQWEWVDRASMDELLAELTLSYAFGAQSSAVLEAGNLLRADVIIAPSLDREAGELTFRIIEVSQGSLLGEMSVPISFNRAQQPRLSAALLEATQEKMRSTLASAIREMSEGDKRLAVAPLFMQHTGEDPRTDVFVADLEQQVVGVAHSDGRQMLRFEGASTATGEEELAILGLAKSRPDAWKELADLYLWVEVDSPAIQPGVTVEAVPMTITVWLWPGYGELQSKTMTVPAGELEQASASILAYVDGVLETLDPEAAPDDSSRDKLTQLLSEQATRILNELSDLTPDERTQPRQITRYEHAVSLLETALFFSPENKQLRSDLLFYRWAYYPVLNKDRNVTFHLNRATDYVNTAKHEEVRMPIQDWENDVNVQATLYLVEALQVLETQTWNGDFDPLIAHRLQADLMAKLTDALVDLYRAAKSDKDKELIAKHIAWSYWLYDRSLVDPRYTIALTESLQGYYVHSRLDDIFMLYDVFGNSSRALELYLQRLPDGYLNAIKKRPVPESIPDARPARKGSPPPRKAFDYETDEDFWETYIGGDAAYADIEELELVTEVTSHWPKDYITTGDIRYRTPLHEAWKIKPANDHAVRSLLASGDSLFVAETAQKVAPGDTGEQEEGHYHYFWCFDTVTREAKNLTDLLPHPYPVNAIVQRDGTLYLGLQGGGLVSLDLGSQKLEGVAEKEGLAVLDVQALTRDGGDIYIVGFESEKLAAARLSLDERKVYSLPDVKLSWGQAVPRGEDVEIESVLHGKWLVVSTGEGLGFYDTKSSAWAEWEVSLPAELEAASQPMRIQSMVADGTTLYLGTTLGLLGLSVDEGSNSAHVERLWEGDITAVHLTGRQLWASAALPTFLVGEAGSIKLEPRPSSMLLRYDLDTAQCTGKAKVYGLHATVMARVGNELWLGSERTPYLLVKVVLPVDVGGDVATSSETPAMMEAYPLHRAVKSGDTEKVRALLSTGNGDIGTATASGWTPLMIAADQGNLELVQLLLEQGASPGPTLPNGYTAMHLAVRAGHMDIVATLLASGMSIDERGPEPPVFIEYRIEHVDFQKLPPASSYTQRPPEPKNVKAVVDEFGRVTISWDATSRQTAYYEIHRSDEERNRNGITPNAYTTQAQVENSIGEIVDLPYAKNEYNLVYEDYGAWEKDVVLPGTTYTYQVFAHNLKPGHWSGKYTSSQPVTITTPEAFKPIPDVPVYLDGMKAKALMGGWTPVAGFPLEHSPLAVAVLNGDLESVKWLVENGADLEASDAFYRTPLLLAAESGRVDIVNYLLEHGADADAYDSKGVTCLMIAYQRRDRELFELMLKHADGLKNGPQILNRALATRRADDIAALLDSGYNLNYLSIYQRAIARSMPEVIDLLFEAVHERTGDDWTRGLGAQLLRAELAREAIEVRNTYLLQRMLEAGFDPNQTMQGFTPRMSDSNEYQTFLMMAVVSRNDEMVALLLESGADPSIESSTGKVALDYAEYESTVALLDDSSARGAASESTARPGMIQWEANPDLMKTMISDGWSGGGFSTNRLRVGPIIGIEHRLLDHTATWADMPIHIAARKGDQAEVARLLAQGEDINSRGAKAHPVIICALSNGHSELAEWLIEEGAEVNICTSFGSSAIAYAANAKDIKLLKLMLRYGADPNLYENGAPTPLMIAVSTGNLDVVKLLVENGADPSLTNWSYTDPAGSALRNAAVDGHYNIAEYLLEQGALVNARPVKVRSLYNAPGVKIERGYTALNAAAAAKGDQIRIVKLLLDHGADPTLMGEDGLSSADLALRKGNMQVYQYLEAL